MIIYHQLTMKLIKNVRNYVSGKVLTVQNDPYFYNKHFSEKNIPVKKTYYFSIDTGTVITIGVTAFASGITSVFLFWNCFFKPFILPYYQVRFIDSYNKVHPPICKIPIGGKTKNH